MKTSYPTPNRSTPLPSDDKWLKLFNTAIGDPDPKRQAALAKEHQLSYRSGVGELIWAMTTCRPDLAYTAVKLSQSNTSPDTIHFNGLKHALKVLIQLTRRRNLLLAHGATPRTNRRSSPYHKQQQTGHQARRTTGLRCPYRPRVRGFRLGHMPQDKALIWRRMHPPRRWYNCIQMPLPTHSRRLQY